MPKYRAVYSVSYYKDDKDGSTRKVERHERIIDAENKDAAFAIAYRVDYNDFLNYGDLTEDAYPMISLEDLQWAEDDKPKVVWYAAGDGIKRTGPYDTEIEAWQHMLLSDEEQYKQQSIHPKDTRVWPEYKNENT
jgi:hypothetical protein